VSEIRSGWGLSGDRKAGAGVKTDTKEVIEVEDREDNGRDVERI
jgi:hypothetical protein